MYEEAKLRIIKAESLREIGDLEGAFDNYQTALMGLLDIYKVEENGDRRTELGELIGVTSSTSSEKDLSQHLTIRLKFLIAIRT